MILNTHNPLHILLLQYYHYLQTKGHVPTAKIPATSDEYVLDQLSTCEEKLLKLLEELDGKDLNEVFKQMEDEEVRGLKKSVFS